MNNPLVSCIMPTANRPEIIPYAIDYFLSQRYKNVELVIIDDSENSVYKLIPDNTKIRYFYCQPLGTIGAIRNLACSLAQGEIIIHWDDDDWYAEDWITRQVATLTNSNADICGLNKINFFEPFNNKRHTFTDATPERPWVYGPTLAYWKSFWEKRNFQHMQLGEDNDFVMNSGAKICINAYTEGYLGILHGRNLSMPTYENPKEKHQLAKWIQVIEKPHQAELPSPPSFSANAPLVSCIMPTANRRRFIPTAIDLFFQQDYPNKELVIFDNGQDPVEDIIPKDERIRYYYMETSEPLGIKRNRAIAYAQGELITHWDDDDWYAADWLSHQVQALINSGADLAGINQVQFYSPTLNKYWMTKNMNSRKPWLTGASLIYRKAFWEQHPFKGLQIGEDDDFIRNNGAKVFAHDYYQGFMATLHPNNTSIKFFEEAADKNQ